MLFDKTTMIAPDKRCPGCLGGGLSDPQRAEGMVQRYAERMRENGFEAVLVLQCVYLPFDLMNCLAGFLRIRSLGTETRLFIGRPSERRREGAKEDPTLTFSPFPDAIIGGS